MAKYKEFEIYKKVASFAKVYPLHTFLYSFDSPLSVRRSGFVLDFDASDPIPIGVSSVSTPDYFSDSLRRTKSRLSDLIVCNGFDLFCTFTFARDRQNVSLLKSRMSKWLNNQYNRKGAFDYVIVPEFHKDGKSIHFHALFRGYSGVLEDTGHFTKSGRVSYILSDYKFGFSTGVKIPPEDIDRVGSYVKKYITKDMPMLRGKKRYWCSQGLTRPIRVVNPVVSDSDLSLFSPVGAFGAVSVSFAPVPLSLVSSDVC